MTPSRPLRAGISLDALRHNYRLDRMGELLALGVDGIVTDRADLALEVVRSL